jgi:transposase
VPRASRARGQPNRRDPRPSPGQALIAKASKPRKKGACIDPHGGACPRARQSRDPWDAGKKIKGKKRHILVDTQGLLLHAIVHGADIQDRDGGALLLATLFGMFPFLLKLYADGGYQGPQFHQAVAKILRWVNIEIVKRSDQAKGFVVLPKRWVVERTLAWLNRCRRLAKDWENLTMAGYAPFRPLPNGHPEVSGGCVATTNCRLGPDPERIAETRSC